MTNEVATVVRVPIAEGLRALKGWSTPDSGSTHTDGKRRVLYQNGMAAACVSAAISSPDARIALMSGVIDAGVAGLESLFLTLLTDPEVAGFPPRWDNAFIAWLDAPDADAGAVFVDIVTGDGYLLSPRTLASLKPRGVPPNPMIVAGREVSSDFPHPPPFPPPKQGGNSHLVMPGVGVLSSNLSTISTARITGATTGNPVFTPGIWSGTTWAKAFGATGALAAGAAAVLMIPATVPVAVVVLIIVGAAATDAGAIIAVEASALQDATPVTAPADNIPAGDITVSLEPSGDVVVADETAGSYGDVAFRALPEEQL